MDFSDYTAYKEYLKRFGSYNSRFSVLNDANEKIKRVILKNEIEVNNTLSNLKYTTILESTNITKRADIIYVFACGPSTIVARQIQLKLQLSNKYCEMYSDVNIIKTLTNKINKKSAVIFVSLNGETKQLVETAKILHKRKINTITFTANPQGTINKYSNVLYIGYKSKKRFLPGYEVNSRLPLQIMARIFLDTYVVRFNIENKN